MLVRLVVVAALSALVATNLGAQAPVAPGDTARFLQGRFWVEGTVVSIGDSLIVEEKSGTRRGIRLSSSSVVERPAGRGSKWADGLVIGAVTGLLVGATVGLATAPECGPSDWFCVGPGGGALIGSVGGAIGGAVLGAALGAVTVRRRWKPIPLNQTTVAIDPDFTADGPGVRVGLRVPLR